MTHLLVVNRVEHLVLILVEVHHVGLLVRLREQRWMRSRMSANSRFRAPFTKTAMAVRPCIFRKRAFELGSYPTSSTTLSTRIRALSLTFGWPFSTRETVPRLYPESRAMSRMSMMT